MHAGNYMCMVWYGMYKGGLCVETVVYGNWLCKVVYANWYGMCFVTDCCAD